MEVEELQRRADVALDAAMRLDQERLADQLDELLDGERGGSVDDCLRAAMYWLAVALDRRPLIVRIVCGAHRTHAMPSWFLLPDEAQRKSVDMALRLLDIIQAASAADADYPVDEIGAVVGEAARDGAGQLADLVLACAALAASLLRAPDVVVPARSKRNGTA